MACRRFIAEQLSDQTLLYWPLGTTLLNTLYISTDAYKLAIINYVSQNAINFKESG